MRVLVTIEELSHQMRVARERGDRIGLVPTRGDLHDGHASLVRIAHAQCDLVVCSIVRPDGVPAFHEAADERVARDGGAHLLWRPMPGPLVARSRLRVVPADAPDFAGVATADAQQLGIVRPDVVYVGDGHFDHARLLRDVTTELFLDVEVRVVETPRDPDGLPIGGTTRHLDSSGRDAAAAIPRALDAISAAVADGERSLFRMRARAEARLVDAGPGLDVEDVATVDPHTFEPLDVFDRDVLLVLRTRVGGLPIVDSRLLPHDSASAAQRT
ncbi:MAG: pantoate--beta-alanine ligase [Thermoleophilia bacterium]|nr:pantoate--beta-alanine ligase [Thermoleophilia bacterium]